jgi:hypothetical protein
MFTPQFRPVPLHLPDASLRQFYDPDNVDRRRFTTVDDDRLAALMQSHLGEPMSPREWRKIAAEFQGPFTGEQLQHRWDNFLRPPLNRAEFGLDERREALKLYLETPKNWKKIASRLGDGKSRSPEMIENLVRTLIRKLEKIGLRVTCTAHIDSLPEEFFAWGFPKGPERRAIIAAFEASKLTSEKRPLGPATPLKL